MKTNKNLYLDVHVLQTVPPSCVNRDDTGSPKTAVFGGANRARVSSQAWKRAMRLMFRDLFEKDQVGYRTKKIKNMLVRKMQEIAPEKGDDELEKMAEEAIVKAKIKGDSGKKDVLFFVSSQQIDALANVALEYAMDDTGKKEKDKKYKDRWREALNQNPSIDILLFGRMAASDPELSCDAAAQVAHCISTHAVSNEYDYFTAVDDCGEEDSAGAGHLGTVEFNSSTLYRYTNVNIGELFDDGLDADEISSVINGYLEAFIKSMPNGKQNTFANRTVPCFTYVTIRKDQPVNMAGAFEKPVPKSQDGYEKKSIETFIEYIQKVYENYVDEPEKSWVVCLDETGINAERVKMDDLPTMVAAEIKKNDEKGE